MSQRWLLGQGHRERGLLFSLFCFKSHDKFHKVNKSRVVTGTIRSCLHIGTTLLLLPLLLLFNLNSSYYFPGVNIPIFIFFSVTYILPSQAAGGRFRENETLESLKDPVTLEILTLPYFSGPLFLKNDQSFRKLWVILHSN